MAMAMNSGQVREQRGVPSEEEDPIKHTEAGEMPDLSAGVRFMRRLQADAPVLYNEVTSVRGLLSLLVVGLGLGGFFVYKAASRKD